MKPSAPDAMKHSPEDLERFVHKALREIPEHRAPSTLELRVLAEIRRRAELPWWRQSYAAWPVAARVAFVAASGLAAAALVLGFVLATRNTATVQVAGSLSENFGMFFALRSMAAGALDTSGVVFRAIPSLWLYGTLAVLGACYATVIGVGAATYRAFFARP